MAKIAGVPKSLLKRATEKLSELESFSESRAEFNSSAKKQKSSHKSKTSEEENVQLSFFGAFLENPAIERLKNIDLMEITPSKAIGILEELQELARKN